MKNADLKPHPHLAKRSRDYLLTLTVDGVSRKVVWNDATPLPLEHPHGWTLAKIGQTLSFYDSTEPDIEKQIATTITIPAEKRGKANVKLPPALKGTRRITLYVSLSPLIPLQPPYKQVGFDGHPNPQGPLQVLMYHGIRYFLMKYRPVGAKLTARSGDNKIFSYVRSPQGYSITALTHNLTIKTKGKKVPLPFGVPILIPEAEFFSAVILQGIYWWRFRAVISPNAMAPLEEDETEDNERELQRFRFATQSVVTLLLILFVGAYGYKLMFPPKPEPVVTKIELKAPKVIPHKFAEVKPTPAPTPVPTPEPVKKEVAKKEPPKKEPVKKEPPPKVAKKEPVKKEAPPKIVAKKEPAKTLKPKKTVATQVAKKPEPVAGPPAPVPKAKENAPNPGVVAKKMPAPPAPDDSAQVLKSLSFLSSGSKKAKMGGVAKYDKAAKKDFMSAPALGGGSKNGSDVLDKLSATSGNGSINTKSSRTIAADTGFDAPKGKGLNEVQGKVSLTELYSGGGSGGGFSDGVGIAISGPGQLSEGEIEKALAKYIARFQFCYEKSLLSDSSLAGNIRMQWTITNGGKASDAKVLNSQMNNEALHRCIVKVLKDIPFPNPKGGAVTAKKTFSFKSTAL